MSSTIGNNLKITIFGESHNETMGIVMDGLTPGFCIDKEQIQKALLKRQPNSLFSNARLEADEFEFVSGYFNNKTTGSPLCILVKNNRYESKNYNSEVYRPSHADYTTNIKFNGFNDYRGGGFTSGRLTVLLTIAGNIAKQILEIKGIKISSHVLKINDFTDKKFDENNFITESTLLDNSDISVIDNSVKEKMIEFVQNIKSKKDSCGGVIETAIYNLPLGIGAPFFDSLESVLSHYIFSIPAIKGIEFGLGFDFANSFGSQCNDEFYYDKKVKTKTNCNGGINGGISNGMLVTFNVVVKPTPSIGLPQKTINKNNEEIDLVINGNHDTCIALRCPVIIESVTALAILDQLYYEYGRTTK